MNGIIYKKRIQEEPNNCEERNENGVVNDFRENNGLWGNQGVEVEVLFFAILHKRFTNGVGGGKELNDPKEGIPRGNGVKFLEREVGHKNGRGYI